MVGEYPYHPGNGQSWIADWIANKLPALDFVRGENAPKLTKKQKIEDRIGATSNPPPMTPALPTAFSDGFAPISGEVVPPPPPPSQQGGLDLRDFFDPRRDSHVYWRAGRAAGLLPSAAQAQQPLPGASAPEAGAAPPPRKVKTEAVAPATAFSGDSLLPPAEKNAAAEAAADEAAYTGEPFDASPLIDLYRERLSALADEPKESLKDRWARMLINFGAGTYTAASNIKGRTRGPGFAESFGGGATNMGLGELEEKTNKEARAEKRGEKSFSALSDLMKLHLDLQKARDDQRHKAAELAQRGQYYKILGGKEDNTLAKSVLTALGQGADPDEIVRFLTAVGGADPALLERLKALSTGQ